MSAGSVTIAVLAHQEAARIALCLASIVADAPDAPVHVLVNGSTDATADIARTFAGQHPQVAVHEWAEGGKSRTWNRFVFDCVADFADTHIFVDGDAVLAPGAIAALVATLAAHPSANAAAGMPGNGRRAAQYRAGLRASHGLFGDLYALRGSFLARMKAADIRLPDDLIGDDSVINALAKTDLGSNADYRNDRVMPCDGAYFLCDPVSPWRWSTIVMQYRRMKNYSVRHFQNRLIVEIMTRGASTMPRRLAALYPESLGAMTPRYSLKYWWFDRLALKRMRGA
ncbi:MAG: glycosyltransferase family 2 protein [Sphingopyxis sp.]|nr:glycosyltransferase family 2 protein [Sphingopyxis sp.]